jgi:hypothetical protein
MTNPTWPAPRPRPGSKIVHSWRCDRKAAIVETTKRDPAGRLRVVFRCQGCGHDDMAERLLTRSDGGDAA